MSINFEFDCDECKHKISDGEPIYCQECYDNLLKSISDLEMKVSELTEERDNLKDKVNTYEQDL